ncbi:MAG TPA: transglutaminase family protein [Phycisphaerae bacterium]|nr:transglutaminase family protein [Phycisphaerae bacterium]HNU43994.1 transglutaminase family protein [Phycisphaerae bacterium]
MLNVLGRALLIAALLGWVLPVWAGSTPGPLDPNDPPQGRFSDDWLEVYLSGSKIGYGQSTMSRAGDLIHSRMHLSIQLARANQKVGIAITQEFTEKLDGTPVSFSSEMDMAQAKLSLKGTIEQGKVTVVASQFGVENKSTYDFPAGAVMLWGAFRESLLRGFQPGTEYTLKMYVPDLRLDDGVEAVTRVGEWESFTVRGKELRGQRVTVGMSTPGGSYETITWVDKHGWTLKATVPMPGVGNLEMITSDEESALAEFVPPEFFMQTTIPVRPLPTDRLKQVKYRISGKDPALQLNSLPTTGMQAVRNVPDGTAEVTVTRQEHKLPADAQPLPPPAVLAEYLQSNLMMNLQDPELIKLAEQAAGDVTEPFALADRLRRFVSDYVKTKSLNIGFATANEVCRNKEGDCSEHGILLAALARLRGLPSRVVVGLAYVPQFGGREHLFGYHLWTQVWIHGAWYDIDAALGETQCGPTRIALAVSSLKDAGLADLSLPLIKMIGSLNLEVLAADPPLPEAP